MICDRLFDLLSKEAFLARNLTRCFQRSQRTYKKDDFFVCFFPAEGLAVGVGFGAIGKTSSATFESAR